ncbi:hypothetical protein ColLi_06959 [Colletotrichum liriopes]|uniref:Uncharacterized protein n=1 Tax=Colletotrichum liriopes TaxID=708192 RepID=A0AA37GN61_9PEZI|nr:hypothetical protein ColLi_06959 [Colletotrichum liriopes]
MTPSQVFSPCQPLRRGRARRFASHAECQTLWITHTLRPLPADATPTPSTRYASACYSELPSGITRMLCLRFSRRRSSLDSTIEFAVLLNCAARTCTDRRLPVLFGPPKGDSGSDVGGGASTGDMPSETTLRCSPLHLKTRDRASEYFTRRRSSSIE